MSDAVTGGGFDDRMGWSIEMQSRFAVPVYKEYWGVPESDITEVDAHAENEKTAREIDASGIDKVIKPKTGVRHVAQRFRTRSEIQSGVIVDPDFSIRVSTYNNKRTEYDKLLNAYRNGGQVPKIYTFGVASSTEKKESLQSGFKEFYFLKLPRFLKLVDGNNIQPVAAYSNGDGSKALYFDMQDLRDARVIQDSISGHVLSSAWEPGGLSDDFPTAPGIKNTGQLNLSDFGGVE